MVAIATLLTGAEAVQSLLGLGSPGVTIGQVTFDDMEVPEKMTFGGQHQLTVHKLVGGRRVVDAMGPDDDDITWNGIFYGGNAASRARQLDLMRNSGKPYPLTWADFSRPAVVIKMFQCDYTTAGNVLPYRMTVVVIPQPGVAAQPSLLSSIGADIGNALGVPNLVADAQSALSFAQRAMPLVGVITGGSAAFVKLSGAVGAASGVVSAGASLADGTLGTLASKAANLGQVTGGTDALTAASAFSATSLAATASAAYHEAAGFVGRISANLSHVGS